MRPAYGALQTRGGGGGGTEVSLGALLREGGCVTEARELRHWGKGAASLGEGGCVTGGITGGRGMRH